MTNDSRWRACLLSLWRWATQWAPDPVQAPNLDPDYYELSVLVRVAEIIRFRLACLEHWLSPCGASREMIRVMLRFMLVFAAALPILAIIAFTVKLVLEIVVMIFAICLLLAALGFRVRRR